VTRKKALFFRGLLPLVEAENAHIRAQRRYIEERFALGPLRPGTRNWNQVEKLAELYRVPGDLNDPVVREILLRRVDEVPAALVLAQAANESAWGTSRFAREANNLFGLWTYKKDLGMVPAQRMEGARHYVRVFPDLRSSVRVYLFNLNIGHAYVDMRRARAALRLAGAAFDAEHLAAGLLRYSERGAEYVAEIQRMIRSNGLGQLGPLQLAPEEP
jgi:Bax protein